MYYANKHWDHRAWFALLANRDTARKCKPRVNQLRFHFLIHLTGYLHEHLRRKHRPPPVILIQVCDMFQVTPLPHKPVTDPFLCFFHQNSSYYHVSIFIPPKNTWANVCSVTSRTVLPDWAGFPPRLLVWEWCTCVLLQLQVQKVRSQDMTVGEWRAASRLV